MPDIMHLFKFAVPREQAYQAIATANGVPKSWCRFFPVAACGCLIISALGN